MILGYTAFVFAAWGILHWLYRKDERAMAVTRHNRKESRR